MNHALRWLHPSFSGGAQDRRYALALFLIISSFPTTVHAHASTSDSAGAPKDASSVASPSPSASDSFAADPFAKGARYWSVTAGASYDASLGQIYLTEINVSHYVAENLAVECGGILGYANMKRTESGALGGIDLGVRWHFAKNPHWSTYLEAIAGAVYQQHPLAVNTLRFNFDLQPGLGASYRLNTATLLQSGFRWHHLSNSQVRGRAHNFGYDGPLLYLEVLRSF